MNTLRARPPSVAALAASLLALALAPAPSPALEASECHAGHHAYLKALERHREQRLSAARESLADAADEARREQIEREGESAWDHEEQMRGLAARNLRDCLEHAERIGAGSG